jgi:hypothetical protein
MKEFIYRRDGASKTAALVLVFFLFALSGALSQTPTPQPCVYAVTMTISNAGHDYVVGDQLRAIGGSGCLEAFPLSLSVTSVDSSGGVTAATISVADSNGYLTPPGNPISFGGSATGSNFKANCTFAPH